MKGQGPIIIAVANTTDKKMDAIHDIASAIKNLSIALNSVSTKVDIKNCKFDVP
ncbi:unnamed protein product, partial [marine sediment metagenome]